MPDAWYLDDCAIEARLVRRAAGRLAGVWHFPKVAVGSPARLGEIYLARAGAHRPSAGGVFLDLGSAGEGFLRVGKGKPPAEGALIPATVVQEAVAGKAPRLAAGIHIEGRAWTLIWDGIERFEGRAANDMSNGTANETERSLLRSELGAILARAKSGVARRIAETAGPARKLIAHARSGDDVRVAGTKILAEARAAAGVWELAAHILPAPATLFEEEGIEAEIEAALEPVVALPGGGRLIVEMTHALTAIDVDAGAGRAAEANEQAAEAIPFEIAARGLAGTILVDFAQVRDRRALTRLGAAVAQGAARLGLDISCGAGRRGLLDLRRARAEAPLAARLTRAGLTHLAVPVAASFPAQAARLARAIERARPSSRLEARVPKAFHDWLHGDGKAFLAGIAAATPARLELVAAEMHPTDGFELVG